MHGKGSMALQASYAISAQYIRKPSCNCSGAIEKLGKGHQCVHNIYADKLNS